MAPGHGAFEIRPAVASDLEAIQAIDAVAFDDGVPAEPGELERGVEDGTLAIAESGGSPIGFVQWCDADGIRYISGIAVAPEAGRRGVGRALLSSVVDSAPEGWVIEATTAPDNVAMLALGTAMGFRGERYLTDAFGPGTDRIIMRRAPLPCPPMPGSTFHIPIATSGNLSAAIGDGNVLTDIAALPHGPAWRLCRVDEGVVVSARANESAVAVGFASVVLGAIAFLLGFGLASESFPSDLLAALSIALMATMASMLVYANTTGELTSLQFGSFNRAMSIGNIVSEFGGVYPVFHIVPVALASITGSTLAGAVACVGSSLAALAYQRSPFDILDRYRDRHVVFMAMTAWLVVAPVVGFASYLLAESTVIWSTANVVLLALITLHCLRREEHMRSAAPPA